ncbi:phosphatase PAP2 family protein [Microbacterium sp. AZCO]|uniref:phosphatase PAP2 family protein n=1 Tax=Microbacterium sp. AZCO TaxID=3142976 RepID=UPI0031F452A5
MTVDQPQTTAPVRVDQRRWIVLIVGIVATILFAVLRLFVALGGHDPLPGDVWWHTLMVATETDAGIFIAWIPATVGGTIGMIVIGIVLVSAFALRRRYWDAANMAAAIIIVVAIGAPMAAIIARARPTDSLAEKVATSFPSGHTAVATTVFLTLALILRRWWIWVSGVVWVGLMMWSRTYLHAHWLSDVVAGLLEGIAVGCLVWCAVEAIRDRRALRKREAPPAGD